MSFSAAGIEALLVTLPVDDFLAAFALRICSRRAADDLELLDGDFDSLVGTDVLDGADLACGRGVESPCEDGTALGLTVREDAALGVAKGRKTGLTGFVRPDFCMVADTLAPADLPKVFTLVEDESALPAVVALTRDLEGFLTVPVLVDGIGGISGTIVSPSLEPGRLV
jgi:hypothetical protein